MSRIPGGFKGEPRLLVYSDAVSETLNGATSITQGANGELVFTGVPGGAATPNLDDATYVLFRAKDILGEELTMASGEILLGQMVHLLEQTAPGLTSDTYAVVGIIDDLTVADARGWFCGIVYTGGGREVRAAKYSVGTTTATDSGALANLDAVVGNANMEDGPGWGHLYALGFDSSDYTTDLGVVSRFSVDSCADDLYVIVAVGRTAATAGAVTVGVRAAYVPPRKLTLSETF